MKIEINDEAVAAALLEYDLSLRTDPRMTQEMQESPHWLAVLKSIRTEAMRAAIGAAIKHKTEGEQ